VIAWIAEQSWCSGAVGMFGKSWGGFNGLQVASHRPPALKAVISAYSTDDRYADDVHYMGGCVLGHEVLSWPSYMLGINALPPDPAIVGARWREMWHQRLRDTPPFLETWLPHQRRDDFWRQGSICEDFSALQCAVLLVGGWADGYKNAVGRALAGLDQAGVACRGLLGPWSHGWPEVAEPGPRIGFLQECLRWWDHWLKGLDTGAMDGPLLRAWMQEYAAPAARVRHRPGRWVGEDAWPSPRIESQVLYPQPNGTLAGEAPVGARLEQVGSERAGRDAGAWCPYGTPTDFPPDQRAEDGLALCFTSAPLSDRVEILGFPDVTLEVTADRPLALIAVRLCDVAPDGTSLLVARGLLNLAHRFGHDQVVAVVPGERMVVDVRLDLSGHAFDVGHRVRLAISPTYWPFAWPSPERVTLGVNVGRQTHVTLPVRPPDPGDAGLAPYLRPELAAPLAGRVETASGRTVSSDLATGRHDVVVHSDERSRLDGADLDFGERTTRGHTIYEGEPTSARLDWDAEHFIERGPWRIGITTRTALSATAETFLLTTELDAYEGDRRVYASRRSVEIPRDGV
jgi:putative CocE/NonD family hydrolase